ncbi:MAG: ATP synthase F1 subunit epsilon [Planctomycetota bacterium]|nr:ATP synthase F1 subunit epsilon [Planctomycetota bacterium]
MSAKTLTLRIVSPEGSVVETEAVSVRVPGEGGSFGVLPRHASMVSLTDSGLLSARTPDGRTLEFLIHDGFAEVRDDVVTVLTRSAEDPAAIDLERAAEAAKRARDHLRAEAADMDSARAVAALRRALMREKVARRQV